jgi:hypothetical protein
MPTLFAWACLVGPRAADAQITAGATAGPSTQREGDSDRPYLGPGFGGTTIGGVAFIDAALAERLSLGGEVSLGADVKGRQTQRTSAGSNDLQSRHHDTIFSGVVKVKTPPTLKAQIGALVGLGVGWRRTIRSGTFRSDRPPFSTTPVDETLSNAVLAATFGVDGAIAISPRAAMLFTARLHLLKDDDRDPSGVVRRGVDSVVFRFGGGALIRF